MASRNLDKGVGRRRLLGIGVALVLTQAIRAVATLVAGLRLQSPASNGYPAMDIGPLTVAVATVALSLIGWGVLAGLERLTIRARGLWLTIALLGLVGSLFMPLSGADVSTADRAVLVLMQTRSGSSPSLCRSRSIRLPMKAMSSTPS
ncbi:MAG: DUF6069 family protein [Chloroflexota bacterium]